jgi:uncharacterized protein (TIGR03437 family)
MHFDLLPGENASAVTVRAEDQSQNAFPLTVEFVGKVPGFDWLTQIVVRLPDNTPTDQSLFVSATLRGRTSNKVECG